MTGDEAMAIIIDRRGTMYDPRVVDAMRELHASGGLLTPEIERAAPAAVTATPPAPAPATLLASPSTPGETEMASAEAFAMLGAALTRAAGPADAGACVWNALRAVIPGSACALFAYEPSADSLRAVFTAGEPTLAPGEMVPVGERLSGWVAATRRSMLNADARLDLATAAYDATALRAALAVPVVENDYLHGVLTFYARDPQAFSELHLRLADAAARVVAPAMHRTAPALRAVAV
jgi:hypothetical protein